MSIARQIADRNRLSKQAREEQRRERERVIVAAADVRAYERQVVRAALDRLERDRAA